MNIDSSSTGICATPPPRGDDGTGDDDVLMAVLSFLDDHDVSDAMSDTTTGNGSTISTSSSDSGGGDSPVDGSPEKTTPRVRSDKRQRDEMISLREESLALQDRLATLQKELMHSHHHHEEEATSQEPPNKKRIENETTANTNSSAMGLRKLRAQAWQAITELQLQRREAAEQERDRLRALIKEQKLAFRRLRRYLAKHKVQKDLSALEATNTSVDLHERSSATSSGSSSSDPEDNPFEEISRTIPAMLLQAGALFKDTRLDSLTASLREFTVQNEESSRMSFEALESRVVPFDMMATADAVWKYQLTSVHRRVPTTTEKLEISDDSIRRTFVAAITGIHGSVTHTRGRMEIRRFVEPTRVVVVKSSIMDRIEVDSTRVPNLTIREFQWTVISPPRNAKLRESGKPLSQVEIFSVSIPSMPDSAEMNQAAFRQAAKHGCVEAVTLQLEFERQSVENILLQKLTTGASLSESMLQLPTW